MDFTGCGNLPFDAHHEPLEFTLLRAVRDGAWRLIIDTTQPGFVDRDPYPGSTRTPVTVAEPKRRRKGAEPLPEAKPPTVTVAERSIVILQRPRAVDAGLADWPK